MVKKFSNTEMLMDIRERTVAIETHLKDMNGKLISHDKFLSSECPSRHNDLIKTITKIKTRNNIFIAISSSIGASALTMITSIILFLIIGG